MDHEKYTWEGSPSQAAAQTVVTARGTSDAEELLKDYEQVVTDLHNEGEIYILFLSKHQTGISLWHWKFSLEYFVYCIFIFVFSILLFSC